MYVLDTPACGKVAWILPPKTGTRSVERLLRKQLGATPFGGRHGVNIEEVEAADLVVSNIRHPCDVIRSWYDYHPSGQRKTKDFDAWVRVQIDGTETINYLGDTTLRNAKYATEYCRYEDGLESEVNRLLKTFGWTETFEVPRVGQSEDPKPWQELFTPHLRELVWKKYRADFDRYEYKCPL